MLGLPKSTECSKQFPKTAIYKKFNMNTVTKEKFDADISRISIVAEISPNTTNIAQGENVSAIYVLSVALKRKDFNSDTIAKISKLIDQNMVLILQFNNECKLAIYHNQLLQNDWQSVDDIELNLKGLTLDAVWENIVVQIGGITIEQGKTLNEQIVVDAQRQKIQKEIARLEKQARAEKQPRKKFELVQQINKLTKGLNE